MDGNPLLLRGEGGMGDEAVEQFTLIYNKHILIKKIRTF